MAWYSDKPGRAWAINLQCVHASVGRWPIRTEHLGGLPLRDAGLADILAVDVDRGLIVDTDVHLAAKQNHAMSLAVNTARPGVRFAAAKVVHEGLAIRSFYPCPVKSEPATVASWCSLQRQKASSVPNMSAAQIQRASCEISALLPHLTASRTSARAREHSAQRSSPRCTCIYTCPYYNIEE